MVGDSNDKTNFPHKLLLTDTHVLRLSKDFANYSSANIKVSKTELSKIVQSGGILGELGAALAEDMIRAGLEAVKKTCTNIS